jgi:ankyrin repeat protein
MYAAIQGNDDVTALLLENGAHANAKNKVTFEFAILVYLEVRVSAHWTNFQRCQDFCSPMNVDFDGLNRMHP